MRVSNSGGWCWFDVSATYASPRCVATYSVTNGPAHGEVVTGAVDQQARIAYRPAPGFLGGDSFLIVNGTTNSQRPVTVTIVK